MTGYGPRVQLTKMTWSQAEGRPLLCIPVGSCEQHGPHLPLDTVTIEDRHGSIDGIAVAAMAVDEHDAA